MTKQKRAYRLIELIYDAAIVPNAWNTFVEELSAAFGGAAVGLSMQLPDSDAVADFKSSGHHAGLLEQFTPVFVRHYRRGLPWGSFADLECAGRFVFAAEHFPDAELRATDFYREFMRPQGLAPEGPLIHVIHAQDGLEKAGLAIYRREGGRPFTTEDLELCNLLVPHLARAFSIQRELGGVQRERTALVEVIDRLPTGVILLDALQRPIIANRSAEQLAALDDGFSIDADCCRAWDPQENTVLRRVLAQVIETGIKHGIGERSFLAISRPSGGRPFLVMASSLLRPTEESRQRDTAAVLFLSNPSARPVDDTSVLELLYSFTGAEAELVGLLAEGCSLEEIAARRGVTMNTVRSQLKQVFSKTDTSRQGQLLQIILTGVATLRDE